MTSYSGGAHRHSQAPGKISWDHPTVSTRASLPPNSLEAFLQGRDSRWDLTRFETVVLVDDSNFMSGPPWQLASDLLVEITKIVAKFDPKGLEVHFFNQANYDLEDATTPELIQNLFAIVEPAGASSPIATLLERELSGYISRYQSNGKLRGLNLLVLTKAFPDNWDRISKVISDAGEEMLVLSAKEQISIQFIQVRASRGLLAFMAHLEQGYVVGFRSNHIVSTP